MRCVQSSQRVAARPQGEMWKPGLEIRENPSGRFPHRIQISHTKPHMEGACHELHRVTSRGGEVTAGQNGLPEVQMCVRACVRACVRPLTLRMLLMGMSVKVPAGAAAAAGAGGAAAGAGAAATACQWDLVDLHLKQHSNKTSKHKRHENNASSV